MFIKILLYARWQVLGIFYCECSSLIGVCPMVDIQLSILGHEGGESFIHQTAGFMEIPQCEEE